MLLIAGARVSLIALVVKGTFGAAVLGTPALWRHLSSAVANRISACLLAGVMGRTVIPLVPPERNSSSPRRRPGGR